MRTARRQLSTPPQGMRVGDYRLLAKIGEGGMGVVHLAQAPDGRRVALKVLRPHIIGDDEARERLAREVASLRRVRSARVAEIIDADPWGSTPFVATRYVPGLSLHDQVRQEGPIQGGDLRHFAAGLAEAVLAVHSVGVLHRDIKPSNVLLEGRSPVLIDFGLARLADDPKLTVTGWLLGTPGYLAPEILYGEEATTASDVHAWGATVVFAATGTPPFGRGPAMAIMDRVRRGEHDLSAVPAEVLPLVRAALAADPESRPALPALLADLGPRGASIPGRADETTMPYVLAARRDDDPTDVLPTDRPATRPASASVAPPVTPPDDTPTVAETRVDGRSLSAPGTLPLTAHQPAARAPFMQPPPPAGVDGAGPGPSPMPAKRDEWETSRRPFQPPPPDQSASPSPWQQPPSGLARLQRGLILAGLFALVAVGFATAPYLCLATLGVAALAVRTWSWTAESARERTWRRGRPRWYDGPLAAATAPWYLLVAAGGTLMLLLWSAALASLTGLGVLLFGPPLQAGLLVVGGVLAFTAWWGPGGRRVRVPTRAALVTATRNPAVGWTSAGVIVLAVAVCGYLLVSNGVSWDPQPGAPWRHGTLLGNLLHFL